MEAVPHRDVSRVVDVDPGSDAGEPSTSPVLDLDDPQAVDPRLTGGKASSLAEVRRLGIRTLPGFVLTTAGSQALVHGGADPARWEATLRSPWAALSNDGRVPLVVRSSSELEDAQTSSQAGQFCSVLDVRGWEAFVAAVRRVQASADAASFPSPMAVLVQPCLKPRCGGVAFGIDPVTGRPDHIVVDVVTGGPEALVSGRAAAQNIVLTRRGRLLEIDHRAARPRWGVPTDLLADRTHLRELARLCQQTAAAFGGPQDIEWAVDHDGTLWVLQCRPVTATGRAATVDGPVLGPGPLAEMFPDPLRPLEVDLWVAPLRDGLRSALSLTHTVPARRLATAPIVSVVAGRAAADLELFGYVGPHRLGWRILDPRIAGRRLRAAWRVGWLRTSLAERAAAMAADVDARLARVPPLHSLGDAELVEGANTACRLLESLHRDEALAGSLLPAQPTTGAAVALAALRDGRLRGLPDEAIIRQSPQVLALVPPRIGPPVALPPTHGRALLRRSGTDARLGPREALRLRARWVQELGARACWTLGRRWVEAGILHDPQDIALLTRAELAAMTDDRARAPADLDERRERSARERAGAPLPAKFTLTDEGEVVALTRPSASERPGVGAGGGRGAGPVCHGSPSRPPMPGDVLVVRTLDPSYAPWLDGLAGLVAETGSTLSHLAILARECDVPTVVAVPDAMQRFPRGTRVLVDGGTGEVTSIDSEVTRGREEEP